MERDRENLKLLENDNIVVLYNGMDCVLVGWFMRERYQRFRAPFAAISTSPVQGTWKL